MRRFVFLLTLLTASYGALANDAAVREYRASMTRMMQEMHIAYSGQVDSDFARGMIPHHQAAVRMAHTLLEHGAGDENIDSLARWIKQSQEAEIAIMRRWLDRRGKAQPAKTSDAVAAMEYVKQSELDMAAMHHGMDIVYSGDPRHDFVCGMIPHHQGAIDMAFVEQAHGSKPEMQALAGRIIRSQKADIARMQDWLSQHELTCQTHAQTTHHHHH